MNGRVRRIALGAALSAAVAMVAAPAVHATDVISQRHEIPISDFGYGTLEVDIEVAGHPVQQTLEKDGRTNQLVVIEAWAGELVVPTVAPTGRTRCSTLDQEISLPLSANDRLDVSYSYQEFKEDDEGNRTLGDVQIVHLYQSHPIASPVTGTVKLCSS